jgi:phosphoribosylglycinamide formyltransferase-1
VVAPEPAADFDDRVDAALRAHGVELVCLCGYLRRLRVAAWRGRALNIHPALLPDFGGAGMYGRRVHEAVLAAGRAESGCTVHWVDEQYDHGETVLQRRCPVEPGDTPETLAARVFAQELLAYPQAIAIAAARVRGRSS